MLKKKKNKQKIIQNGINRNFIILRTMSKKCSNCGDDTANMFCNMCDVAKEEYMYTSVPLSFAGRMSCKNTKNESIVDEIIKFSKRNDYRVDMVILRMSALTETPMLFDTVALMKLNKEIDAWNRHNQHLTFLI